MAGSRHSPTAPQTAAKGVESSRPAGQTVQRVVQPQRSQTPPSKGHSLLKGGGSAAIALTRLKPPQLSGDRLVDPSLDAVNLSSGEEKPILATSATTRSTVTRPSQRQRRPARRRASGCGHLW